jgi:hypothetical protein
MRRGMLLFGRALYLTAPHAAPTARREGRGEERGEGEQMGMDGLDGLDGMDAHGIMESWNHDAAGCTWMRRCTARGGSWMELDGAGAAAALGPSAAKAIKRRRPRQPGARPKMAVSTRRWPAWVGVG